MPYEAAPTARHAAPAITYLRLYEVLVAIAPSSRPPAIMNLSAPNRNRLASEVRIQIDRDAREEIAPECGVQFRKRIAVAASDRAETSGILAGYDRRSAVEDIAHADPEHVVALHREHGGEIEIILRTDFRFQRTDVSEQPEIRVERGKRHLAHM